MTLCIHSSCYCFTQKTTATWYHHHAGSRHIRAAGPGLTPQHHQRQVGGGSTGAGSTSGARPAALQLLGHAGWGAGEGLGMALMLGVHVWGHGWRVGHHTSVR
jgi:hypothetical protein